MSIDTLVQEGWRDHEKDTQGVAARLEAAVATIEKPEQLGGFVQLAQHAIGHHLGDWSRAARLTESAFARVGQAAVPAPVLSLLAVARHLAGDEAGGRAAEERAAAVPGADPTAMRVRVRMLVAEARIARGDRPEEAGALFDAALDAANALPANTPVNRTVAVSANNVAGALLDKTSRTPADDARLLRAARAGRTYWMRVGDWTNDERADYLLAQVSNATGNFGDGVFHAERALCTIERNGEEPVDAAFLRLALARAYGGLGLKEAATVERAKGDRLAAAFDDAGLRDAYASAAAMKNLAVAK